MKDPAPGLPDDWSQHVGDAMIAISRDRKILRLNAAAESLTGLKQEEACGQPCSTVLRSSLCESACPLERVTSSGETVRHFNVQVAQGEGTFPACIVASVLRDAQGEGIGIVESVRDVGHITRLIEEREKAVAEAEDAASRLRSIVDTINDGLIATDRWLRITCFNRAAELLTGYARQEVIGRSCKEVFTNGFCPLEETLSASIGIPGMELAIRGRSGQAIPVWLSTQVLYSGDTVVGAVQIFRSRRPAPLAAAPGAAAGMPLVGESPRMRAVLQWIDRLAQTDTTVLIHGESGTGKELAAESIHYRSARRSKPLIKVNCAALPETLLESELFGHVRGAFTGASSDRPGRFELAHQGTLFLDEIGDLPLPMQGKLLRVLEDRCVERLGAGRPIPVDLRIISATNRDLRAMIAAGQFRQDLYYRLAVVPLEMPPLREHPEDIPLLAANFLNRLARNFRFQQLSLAPSALEVLQANPWPGNVRELQNALEFAAIQCRGGVIEAEQLPPYLLQSRLKQSPLAGAIEKTEREMIRKALELSANRGEAARQLGMSRATLFRKMQRLGLGKPRKKSQA